MRIPLLAALALALPVAAHADTIDQSNTPYSTQLGLSVHAGQSFTRTFNNIDFASFTFESNGSSTVAVNFFQGGGFGGTLLGTSNSLLITSSSLASYTFSFAPITLTPGGAYTLQLAVLSGSSLNEAFAYNNPYAGGTAYLSSGGATVGGDFVFSEGGANLVTATPEPSSIALGTGLLGIFGVARRKCYAIRPSNTAHQASAKERLEAHNTASELFKRELKAGHE